MESGKRTKDEKSIEQGKVKYNEVISDLEVPPGRGKDKVWKAISRELSTRPVQKERKLIQIINWPTGIAASLILVISVYFIFKEFGIKTISAGKGEKIAFQLPDESLVTLNADSKISYKIWNWSSNRNVTLEGEAFFEVEKGNNFRVNSQYGVVEVLGTSFNIFARNDEYKVDCITGKVKVSNKTFNEFKILTPGFATSIKNNRLQSIYKSGLLAATDWKNGEFHFEKANLELVIQELERQYDIHIISNDSINRRLYTGYLP